MRLRVKEIFKIVESNRFAALIKVASSFSIFLKAVYQEEAPKQLIKSIQESPNNLWLVLQRTVELSQQEIDLEYENPWDTALTVYMWALSLVDLELAETAAAFVAEADNCWWAKKFANYILSKKPSKDLGFDKLTFEELKNNQQAYKQKKSKLEYFVKSYFSDLPENKTVKHGAFEGSGNISGSWLNFTAASNQ